MKLKRFIIILLLTIVGLFVGLPVLVVLIALGGYELFDRTNGKIVVAGETREYWLHVPRSYDPASPTPLVISLHGSGITPAIEAGMSGWSRVADEEGFIVVYPAGVPTMGGRWVRMWRTWADMTDQDGRAAEVQFISALIDDLEARYNIDPTRIYADGYSGGGGMVNLLACRLPERFAAFGAVSAAHLPWEGCDGFEPTPLIAFHGTADLGIPYEGGESAAGGRSLIGDYAWPSIASWTGGWAQRNGCGSRTAESRAAADVRRLEHLDCPSGADVVLYTIEGGGHSWPGSAHPPPTWMAGRTSDGVDATRELWAFYQRRRRQAD